MIDIHRRRETWNRRVERLIALTEFAKGRFVAGGIGEEKIVVKPNFVRDPGLPDEATHARRIGALFVGRLSGEKGINTLLTSWQRLAVPLKIVGDGRMRHVLEGARRPVVAYYGPLPRQALYQAMRAAAFLVMPSECYETFGMVIAEAYANGLPVIASRLGAMAELVDDGVTGLHFRAGDAEDLAKKVQWAASHPEEMRAMGHRARQVYEAKYTPEVNYNKLMSIYEEVTKLKSS